MRSVHSQAAQSKESSFLPLSFLSLSLSSSFQTCSFSLSLTFLPQFLSPALTRASSSQSRALSAAAAPTKFTYGDLAIGVKNNYPYLVSKCSFFFSFFFFIFFFLFLSFPLKDKKVIFKHNAYAHKSIAGKDFFFPKIKFQI